MSDIKFGFDEYCAEVKEYTDAFFAREGHRPRAFVRTFGCQQNEADSERLRGTLVLLGYELCDNEIEADCILVNTCAIREQAEIKALSVIGQYKHLKVANNNLIIGVCGCMSAEKHRADQLKNSYPYVDFSLPPASDGLLPKAIVGAIKHKRDFTCLENTENPPDVPPVRANGSKAWVSIMYGCNNFCSYCIVPYVRGRERSRNREEIVREVKGLVRDGYKDITLLGQNVNSYHGGCSFAELLSELAAIEGDFVLRFMTSHPKDVTPELIRVMAENKRVAKHFHLPLQSGSDRILKAMNRRYDRERYLGHINALRAAMPDIAITSDIIVGFPGETEEDFADTLDIIRTVGFDMLYSFIYSPRKGTPAAEMENQIPREVQNERFDRLLKLQAEVGEERNRACVGLTMRVLCEGESKTDSSVLSGRTDGNKLVLFKGTAKAGEFTTVNITDAEAYALHGKQI
ncbi:MAG: tRNA (N6-isopentenyl adenosine(37)-C2)-methylthiotransferase MiaB [Clostridia bacterium]|nr:tRNA (N6-isopentenyl adenosine(37)-C2)-methylthiotransferase MiaB [Clostridia bacterium]